MLVYWFMFKAACMTRFLFPKAVPIADSAFQESQLRSDSLSSFYPPPPFAQTIPLSKQREGSFPQLWTASTLTSVCTAYRTSIGCFV